MYVTKELTDRFEKVKELGDIRKLTKELGFKSHTPTSRVVAGKQATTIRKVSKFKRFIEKREREIKAITSNPEEGD